MKRFVFLFLIFLSFISCNSGAEKQTESGVEQSLEFEEVTDAVLGSGKLLRIKNYPTALIPLRNVDVWLPDDYSENKRYSVLYMHDGQMLFDSTITWNKQEWKVDEITGKLLDEGEIEDVIVVAVWNISESRWLNYFPRKALDELRPSLRDSVISGSPAAKEGNAFYADEYLKFLTQELKPHIDNSFSTNAGRKHTFVSGSSMGGLISWYALCEYPEVFGGAACISTHWPGWSPYPDNPMPGAFFAYLEKNVPQPGNHKFYFDFGTETLDVHYGQYQEVVNALFKEKGYDESNFVNLKFDGEDHSENSWNKRFDLPLKFLMGSVDE